MHFRKGSKNDKKKKDSGHKENNGKLSLMLRKITDVFVGQTGKETKQNKDSFGPSKKQKEIKINKKQVNNNDPAARKMSKPPEKGPSKKQKKIKSNKKQVNNNDPATPIMSQPPEKSPSKNQKKIKPNKKQAKNNEPAAPIMSSQRQSKIKIAKNCNKYKQYLIMKRQNQTKLQIIEKMKPDTNQYEVSSKKKDELKLRKRNNIEKIKIKRENEIKKKRRAARFQRWKFVIRYN